MPDPECTSCKKSYNMSCEKREWRKFSNGEELLCKNCRDYRLMYGTQPPRISKPKKTCTNCFTAESLEWHTNGNTSLCQTCKSYKDQHGRLKRVTAKASLVDNRSCYECETTVTLRWHSLRIRKYAIELCGPCYAKGCAKHQIATAVCELCKKPSISSQGLQWTRTFGDQHVSVLCQRCYGRVLVHRRQSDRNCKNGRAVVVKSEKAKTNLRDKRSLQLKTSTRLSGGRAKSTGPEPRGKLQLFQRSNAKPKRRKPALDKSSPSRRRSSTLTPISSPPPSRSPSPIPITAEQFKKAVKPSRQVKASDGGWKSQEQTAADPNATDTSAAAKRAETKAELKKAWAILEDSFRELAECMEMPIQPVN